MPKGKIEAFCIALLETNDKLQEGLQIMDRMLTDQLPSPQPFSYDDVHTLTGITEAALGLTLSNQVQLKGMLQEAYKKGV